jgi:hypothetical protein
MASLVQAVVNRGSIPVHRGSIDAAPSVAIPATGVFPSHSTEESDRQVHATPTSVRCYQKAVMALSMMLDKVFGGEADKSRIESNWVSISMKSIESVATFTERFEKLRSEYECEFEEVPDSYLSSPGTFHRHRPKRPLPSFEPMVSRGTAGALITRSRGPLRLSSPGTCPRQKRATSFEPMVSRGSAGALTTRSRGPLTLSSPGTFH